MPILSPIIAVAEVFIYGIIFYSFFAHLQGKKFKALLTRRTILVQLVAVVYMLSRLKPAQTLAELKGNLEVLVIGHALLSILVFFWLVILFFRTRNFASTGKNYLQENKKATYLFLIAFSLSFLSGELIFFLLY